MYTRECFTVSRKNKISLFRAGFGADASVFVLAFLSALPCFVSASESFQTYPGTRAMGMAGVFSAQADDSSAIWYNPAGLKRLSTIKSDFTLELAQTPTPTSNMSYGTRSGLKYLGAYLDHLPWWQNNNDEALGIGVAYFSPLRQAINVDAPSNPIDNQPYGLLDVQYRQMSVLFSGAVNDDLSVGGTVDAMWTDVDCRNYARCVKHGPWGAGVTAGLIYSLAQTPWGALNLGAVWRSPVSLDYTSSAHSGLGRELPSYLPGRPQSRNLGLHLQTPAPWALINTNFILEQTLWAATVSRGARLTDYKKMGAGAEFLLPMRGNSILALRLGISRALPQDNGISSAVNITALGMGYSFAKNHFVDLAWETRGNGEGEKDSKRFWSLSYSFQR